MPKRSSKEAVRALEEAVIPPTLRGKHTWPIEVSVLGETARLRLLPDRTRIYFDWYASERFREALGKNRIQRQIPKPSRAVPREDDPGHNPLLAEQWLRGWLRDQVLGLERSIQEGSTRRDSTIENDVPIVKVVKRFRESERYREKDEKQRAQWDLWLDFFLSALGPDYRMRSISYDTLKRLHAGYREPWIRHLPDGTQKEISTTPTHNSAAKVIRFLRTVSKWAVSVPDGSSGYLLDSDPFARVPPEDLSRLGEVLARGRRGVSATDEFTRAIIVELARTGQTAQPLVIFGTEAAIGRRPGEMRTLTRTNLLTTAAEIEQRLIRQLCRSVIPGNHVPEEEAREAAQAIADRGWAIHFTAGKQLRRHPGAVQHDRVVPLGRHLTEIFRFYLRQQWEPLGLPPEAPLCPASMDPTKPTDHSVAINWYKRAQKKVVEDLPKQDLPVGGSHALRHRFRAAHGKQEKRIVAFVGGWSIREGAAMNQHYLPLRWQEVVEFIDRVDETTARCLDGVLPKEQG